MAVTDEAILKIKEMIVAGDLRPGDRLPPEKELSESLGLSRNSLRESVKALELIRVLDVRRGDGTYVTSLEPALPLEAMSFVVDLHGDDSVLEMLAVRRILEPAATSLAAINARPEDLDHLVDLMRSAAAASSVDELVAHDLAFHRAIAEASGNRYLTSLIDSLSSHTVRARIWRGITQESAVSVTLREHQLILDAIRAHDPDLAAALTLAHVAGVEQWLRAALT